MQVSEDGHWLLMPPLADHRDGVIVSVLSENKVTMTPDLPEVTQVVIGVNDYLLVLSIPPL
jgi:hypothetical protein